MAISLCLGWRWISFALRAQVKSFRHPKLSDITTEINHHAFPMKEVHNFLFIANLAYQYHSTLVQIFRFTML